MKYSNLRMFSIFLSAVFVIGALMIFAMFIKPAYKTIAEKRSEVASRESILGQTKAVTSQVKNILSEYQNLSELQNEISLSFPQDSSVASALYQVTSLASGSGLNIESVNVLESSIVPSKEDNSSLIKGTGILNFLLRASGSYETLSLFLTKAENNVRIFDLDTLRIDKTGASNFFDFIIGVNTYYLSN